MRNRMASRFRVSGMEHVMMVLLLGLSWNVRAEDGRYRSLTWPRVTVAIAVLLVLAFVVPYNAVQALHKRRLRAADEGTRAIAERSTLR